MSANLELILGIDSTDQEPPKQAVLEDFWYLIVDIFALRGSARLQDVVVVTMVDDEDSAGSDHTGDVLKGQLLVTLVSCE